MSTIQRYALNPSRLVQEARMIFSSKQKYTLVVEGETDYRLLRQWLVDSNARITKVDGKPKVIDVWNEAEKQNVDKIICLADVDYDCVINEAQINNDRFIYVSTGLSTNATDIESIDIESTLVRSGAFLKLMSNKFSGSDLFDNNFSILVSNIRENLRKASSDLGAFRAADMAYVKAYGKSAIGPKFPVTDVYFDAVGLKVDIDKIKSLLIRSTNLGRNAMEEVIEKAEKLRSEFGDGWQLCKGHDLTEMLALYLSSYMRRKVSSREVEEDLRLACELNLLKRTRFGEQIIRLEEKVGKPFLTAN